MAAVTGATYAALLLLLLMVLRMVLRIVTSCSVIPPNAIIAHRLIMLPVRFLSRDRNVVHRNWTGCCRRGQLRQRFAKVGRRWFLLLARNLAREFSGLVVVRIHNENRSDDVLVSGRMAAVAEKPKK